MMRKREEKHLKTTNFLRKMIDFKELLFAKFSPTITKDIKKQAWIDVRDYAVAINFVTSDKDFTYIRDTTWPNLRQRTMTKVDRAKSTGAAGGSNSKLDSIDELVLEVIGRDSPIIEGIGLKDSFGIRYKTPVQPVEASLNNALEGNSEAPEQQETNQISTTNQPHNSYTRNKTPLHKGKRSTNNTSPLIDSTEYHQLKKKKLQLEIRKLQLDVWEKETSLGVEHCELTNDLRPESVPECMSTLIINDDGEIQILNDTHDTN